MSEMKALMEIAYLIPGCGVSGGIAVVCQHANRLLRRGHNVYLISETVEKNIGWFPNQKVPIITLEEYTGNADILVATGWSTSFRVVDLPAKSKFYFVQSDETRFHPEGSEWQSITALSYRLNFNYLTEARWIQKWLLDNFEHKAELIPNGMDSDIFYPDYPLTPKAKRPRILLEGAIGLPYKGMADAFAAVENLDAEIWCVSSYGEPQASWRCDRFFNQLPMNKMRNLYSSCDVLLKMSRVEGFFGPPLEMMACGGAVVVSKVTGYDEYISDEYNALVVEPGDIVAATAALKRIITDTNLKRKLIYNGFLTAKAWQWESSIDRLEIYYHNILAQKQSKSLVREMADKGIAQSYKLLRNQTSIPGISQTLDLNEPTDLIFLRLKEFKWIKQLARLILTVYKKLKYAKKQIFI